MISRRPGHQLVIWKDGGASGKQAANGGRSVPLCMVAGRAETALPSRSSVLGVLLLPTGFGRSGQVGRPAGGAGLQVAERGQVGQGSLQDGLMSQRAADVLGSSWAERAASLSSSQLVPVRRAGGPDRAATRRRRIFLTVTDLVNASHGPLKGAACINGSLEQRVGRARPLRSVWSVVSIHTSN
jgi:hypothetical protein